MNLVNLNTIEAFLFDLDGCIYFGDTPAPGALKLFELLRKQNKKCFFVTNNSTDSVFKISMRLNNMGIKAENEEVITAGEFTGQYIMARYGRLTVKVVGSKELENSIAMSGHRILDLKSSLNAEAIVIGRDITFEYEKLQKIINEAEKGTRIIGVNPDLFHIGSCGIKVPETGALAIPIEAILENKLEYVGKPGTSIFEHITNKWKLEPSNCLMIGDNFTTDIIGGINSGMKTAWIIGKQVRAVLKAEEKLLKPDLTFYDIQELYSFYIKQLKM